MKVLCIELKILLALAVLAVLLGVITITPCAMGQKGSFLGRTYALDSCRVKELSCKMKEKFCTLCK